MNKATYLRLVKNPHYKLSKKQKAEIDALDPDIHTQQVTKEDLNVVRFKGKRDNGTSRNKVS